jgi:alpha-methylacyl-CoA racemase
VELAAIFRGRSRDEWAATFDGTDACVVPVLTAGEAPAHPHNHERATFATAAPRFSGTPGGIASAPPAPGEHTDEVLGACGFEPGEIAALRQSGVVA